MGPGKRAKGAISFLGDNESSFHIDKAHIHVDELFLGPLEVSDFDLDYDSQNEAWNGSAKKYGALKAYMPMSAKFASPKGVFYRLSVRGFASDADARNLCMALRRQGAACFVRNTAGDQPVNIAMR